MQLKDQLLSKAVCEKLHQRNVKSDTFFYHINSWTVSTEILDWHHLVGLGDGIEQAALHEAVFSPAWSVAELFELLPQIIRNGEKDYWLSITPFVGASGWECEYRDESSIYKSFTSEKLADALGNMLLYLVEQYKVKPEQTYNNNEHEKKLKKLHN